jgi:anti-sigma factor RsiW
MTCDDRRQQANLFLDAELGAAEQPGLFEHLQGCTECRADLEAQMRLRVALRQDRAALERDAVEWLPSRPPAMPGTERPVAWWRVPPRAPVPVLAGLALLLLVAGIFLGSHVPLAGRGAPPARDAGGPGPAPGSVRATAVLVCAMPEYEVVAEREPATMP